MQKKKILKKTAIFLCAGLLAAVPLSGCGKKAQEGQAKLYYVNSGETSLESEDLSLTGSDAEKQIAHVVNAINGEYTNKDDDRKSRLANSPQIIKSTYRDHQLYLYFNSAYSDMSENRELLYRCGTVLTFMQISDISGISFFVDGLPLTDADGEKVGIMTADSFAADLDPGSGIRSSTVNATVYYASPDGSSLIGEDCTLSTDGSSSLCQKVLERMMEEPKTKGCLMTIPKNTKINRVTVLDDVCLVDFSSEFKNQNTKIGESVLVYSIVDSLTSIPGIKTVQISVKGDTKGYIRYNMPYNRYYRMNSDLIRAN